MKELLITTLLLLAVMFVYLSVVPGSEGTDGRLNSLGSRMAQEIQGTDP